MSSKKLLRYVLLLFLCLPVILAAQEIGKSKLHVLYVGGSPNAMDQHYQSPEAFQLSVKERMQSFEEMLNRYFETVTVMHASSYNPAISSDYDVTVMDGVLGAGATQPDYDPKNWVSFLGQKVDVFSPEFDKPVLLIAEASHNAGARIGLKFDWYCLCLENYAYNLKKDHQIFEGPFPVNMGIEQRDTPSPARQVDYAGELSDQIAMWKVEDEMNSDQSRKRPGLICHFGGFLDSPDSEVISGGVSAKESNAVAIGRHGNFFHWGFAGAPDIMTPSAQSALANAIVYIAGFEGERVLARKFSDRIVTSYDIGKRADAATRKAYELAVESGQNLAGAGAGSSGSLTLSDYLRRNQRDLFQQFGEDLEAYQQYYAENMPYFYSQPGGAVEIDEDLKKLKLAKNNPKLLDHAISLLEKNENVEMANRILNRYTLLSYTDPSAWRKWYERNKDRLFFTESGGYHFLVRSNEPRVEGNDYEKKHQQHLVKAVTAGETSDQDPVSVSAAITTDAAGVRVVAVRFNIHPGYHIYGSVSDKDPFIATKVEFGLPQGTHAWGSSQSPRGERYNEGTTIYRDDAVFAQAITGRGTGQIVCKVTYQCCDDSICLPPVEREIILNLE